MQIYACVLENVKRVAKAGEEGTNTEGRWDSGKDGRKEGRIDGMMAGGEAESIHPSISHIMTW
jgi:hypothetical protein